MYKLCGRQLYVENEHYFSGFILQIKLAVLKCISLSGSELAYISQIDRSY